VEVTSLSSNHQRLDSQSLISCFQGWDGHVASLLPWFPLVKENEKWITHIRDSTKPGEVAAVHKASGKTQNPALLPVQMVTPEAELKWFLDKAAGLKCSTNFMSSPYSH
jgi:6-phosphogluconolactonase